MPATTEVYQPRLGTIRANDVDYDGDVVLEFFHYAQGDEPQWHVPAWEERGLSDLEGPFSSVAEAAKALASAQLTGRV